LYNSGKSYWGVDEYTFAILKYFSFNGVREWVIVVYFQLKLGIFVSYYGENNLHIDELMMIMRRQLKNWWSTFTPISTKRIIVYHLDSLYTKRPHYVTLEIHVLAGDRYIFLLDQLLGSQPSSLDNWIGSATTIHI
jgi:hypothetical protein